MWGKEDGVLGRRNVEESQDSSSITQCLLLRWCGWAGFAHALGKWKLWIAFTVFSRWLKGKVQDTQPHDHHLSRLICVYSAPRSAPTQPCDVRLTDTWEVLSQGSPRILEWVAYPFSRGSSRPRDWTQVSCIAGRFFTIWATREAILSIYLPC